MLTTVKPCSYAPTYKGMFIYKALLLYLNNSKGPSKILHLQIAVVVSAGWKKILGVRALALELVALALPM